MAFDEIAQEEVIEANINDGTFFMSYVTWMQYFTHFFAGIGKFWFVHSRQCAVGWGANKYACSSVKTASCPFDVFRFSGCVERSTSRRTVG